MKRLDARHPLVRRTTRPRTNKEQDARRKDWIEYSEALTRRVKRGRYWFEHDLRHLVLVEEDMSRGNLSSSMRVLPWQLESTSECRYVCSKGLRKAVSEYLQSETSAVQMMGINETPCNGQGKCKAISTRTACRWFGRMGWIYGRNKKGYCDGHVQGRRRMHSLLINC